MLVDANLTLAYKCSSCGTFEFFNFSLFKLIQRKQYNFSCHCGKSSVNIIMNNKISFTIRASCISCGNKHNCTIERKNIFVKKINIFGCPLTGLQYLFLGRDEEVRKRVDNLEAELDSLIDTFGYDNYFKNTQVMFDTLNIIHDIAEQGNLICECGCEKIELFMLPDKIELKCSKCMGTKTIRAGSNGDLKKILHERHIKLTCSFPKEHI